MLTRPSLVLLLPILAAILLAPLARADEPLRVVVTVPPLESLVRALAPKDASVRALIQPGRSEHGYEFTPSDLAVVAKADLLVHVGLNLEPQVVKHLKQHPAAHRRVVCFAEVVALQKPGEPEPNSPESPTDHDHAEHDHHHHDDAIDQHLWLDPALVEKLIPALREAVEAIQSSRGRLDDAEKLRLKNAQDDTLAAVRAVHDAYAFALDKHQGAAFVTHHNAFSRLADRYSLTIAATIREFENSEPTPKEIKQILDAIKEHKARAVMIEPNFSAKAAEQIAKAAKIPVARLDPLGTGPTRGDWTRLMMTNLRELTRVLQETAPREPTPQPTPQPAPSK
jgi:zinc transport system substrate-binding protein